ncbi:MAG: IS110 family transposase [Nanoarchaeota archaeon]
MFILIFNSCKILLLSSINIYFFNLTYCYYNKKILQLFFLPNDYSTVIFDKKITATHYSKSNIQDVENIQIGMEATNVYWVHAFRFLGDYKPLNLNYNLIMYRLNPKIVKNFKKAYNDLPKTDGIDAWIIADRLRFGRVKASKVLQKSYEPLLQSTRFRFNLAHSNRAEKNRALNLIFLKFSNYNEEAPFSAFSKASMALLSKYSPDQIATTDIQKLADFLLQNSNNRLSGDTPIKEIAKTIKKQLVMPTDLLLI